MDKNALIIFLKVPEKGQVKTRLSKDLDETFVLELYKGFIHDLLKAAEPIPHCFIYFWPPEKKRVLEKFLENGYKLYPQAGADLGEKMANAFDEVFRNGFDTAVLIGSDIPELSHEILFDAFERLVENDAVLGPSNDGGYYLIGFTKTGFRRNIFEGIEWSMPSAMDETLKSFEQHQLSWSLTSLADDIDTLEDLKGLAGRVNEGHPIGSNTRRNLQQL